MKMDINSIVKDQYLVSLEMLRNAITKCPDDAWNDPAYHNKFWHISYHTLFFTHLYLQNSDKQFTAWIKHRDEHQFMGPLPWPPHREPKIGEPYSKEDILEYYQFCRQEVETRTAQLDMEAESGFWWYPCNKMEFQFINIRHIQHHAGQLIERLKAIDNISIDWIGLQSKEPL